MNMKTRNVLAKMSRSGRESGEQSQSLMTRLLNKVPVNKLVKKIDLKSPATLWTAAGVLALAGAGIALRNRYKH